MLAVAATGCDSAKDGAATTAAASASECEPAADDADTAGATAVPIAIDCSYSFAATQIDVTYEPSNARTETPVGGKLIASGMLSDDDFEGRSFSLMIYAADGSVQSHALYQMDRTRLPTNEFWGDHGFTGLNSVTDPDADESVQFACFARDPAAPPHAWQD